MFAQERRVSQLLLSMLSSAELFSNFFSALPIITKSWCKSILFFFYFLQRSVGSFRKDDVWSSRGSRKCAHLRFRCRKYWSFSGRKVRIFFHGISVHPDRWGTIDSNETGGSETKTFGEETCTTAGFQSTRNENGFAASGFRQKTRTRANRTFSWGG